MNQYQIFKEILKAQLFIILKLNSMSAASDALAAAVTGLQTTITKLEADEAAKETAIAAEVKELKDQLAAAIAATTAGSPVTEAQLQGFADSLTAIQATAAKVDDSVNAIPTV